jgi:hypothetical protein
LNEHAEVFERLKNAAAGLFFGDVSACLRDDGLDRWSSIRGAAHPFGVYAIEHRQIVKVVTHGEDFVPVDIG